MIYISIVFLSEELQMEKKKSGKRKNSVKLSARGKPKKSDESRSQEENKIDFGGLPDVDLKKNLGCG